MTEQRVTLAGKKSERSAPLGRRTIEKVPVKDVEPGMWARASWARDMPFRKVTANFHYDEDRSWYNEPRMRVHTLVFGRAFDPHYPENSTYHVLFRDRRKR